MPLPARRFPENFARSSPLDEAGPVAVNGAAMRASRAPSSPPRVRLLLSLAAFLVGWLAPWVHEATVVHVVCAEHGELAHGGHHDADATPPGLPGGAAVAAGEAGDGDDHCGHVVLRGPRRAVVEASACAGIPLDAAAAPGLVPDATPRAVTRLYRTAPKGSPPRAV